MSHSKNIETGSWPPWVFVPIPETSRSKELIIGFEDNGTPVEAFTISLETITSNFISRNLLTSSVIGNLYFTCF